MYLPYRLVVLVAYLAAAALLLVVMRRAGADPWIATAAASLFALFGTGWANIIRPFQVTFVVSLVLGLVYLILVDHDGPFDRRDWLGLIAGLLALMTSAVAVVMIFLVGVLVLARRGWRLALLHVTPPAVCFLVWLLAIGHKDQGGVTQHLTPAAIVRFIAQGLRAALGGFGPTAWFGVLLTIALVAGLVIAIRERRQSGRLTELTVPLALLAGTVVFLAISAAGGHGNTGAADARQSRYVSLVAALILPSLAIALDGLARQWRWFVPVAVAVLLVGIPHNINTARTAQRPLNAIYFRTKRVMLTVAHDPKAKDVPKTLRPEPASAHQVTVGWLLDGAAHGHIPAPSHLSIFDFIWDRFLIAFYQNGTNGPTTHCTTVRHPIVLTLTKGEIIGVHGGQMVFTPAKTVPLNPNLLLDPVNGTAVEVLRTLGRVQVSVFQKGQLTRVCV